MPSPPVDIIHFVCWCVCAKTSLAKKFTNYNQLSCLSSASVFTVVVNFILCIRLWLMLYNQTNTVSHVHWLGANLAGSLWWTKRKQHIYFGTAKGPKVVMVISQAQNSHTPVWCSVSVGGDETCSVSRETVPQCTVL